MSASSQPFNAPGWHYEAQTPVVDGKYIDRTTGEVRTASGHEEYSGPPAIDIIVGSIHADTVQCSYRAARYTRLEALLWNVMQVVHEKGLELDSLTATPYAVRVVLAHQLTVGEFEEVSSRMVDGGE